MNEFKRMIVYPLRPFIAVQNEGGSELAG